jgi:hypothetical protein
MEIKTLQIQQISVVELSSIIKNSLREEITNLNQKSLDTSKEQEELLTRKDVLEMLKISSVTLWNWQKVGKIKVYKFSNKCFYKRNELIDSLKSLNV